VFFYIKKNQNVNQKISADIYLNKLIIIYVNKQKKILITTKKIKKIEK